MTTFYMSTLGLVITLVMTLSCLELEPNLGPDLRTSASCDSEAIRDFVVKCAKAANPMSDEEGEDLVEECADVARDTFCNERTVGFKYFNEHDNIPDFRETYFFYDCKLAKTDRELALCEGAGVKP